jgi:hypothetical protein
MTAKKSKRKPESDDNEPCYVAKLSCGHYVAATSADGSDGLKDVQEWRDAGMIVETKTVGFVRDGGLTFCECKTWEREQDRLEKKS